MDGCLQVCPESYYSIAANRYTLRPGCLLEVSQPVGPADPQYVTEGKPPLANQPILPNMIVSSSFQGIALMDYDPKGEDELALRKDELLRVL